MANPREQLGGARDHAGETQAMAWAAVPGPPLFGAA
jgi:hypothetical protein